jgi:hypothetical protein
MRPTHANEAVMSDRGNSDLQSFSEMLRNQWGHMLLMECGSQNLRSYIVMKRAF